MDITNSTVFIPGATSGIGLALAQRLHAAGSTVIVGGRRTERLAAIAADHPGIDTVEIDTTDPASIDTAARQVLERHPDLDVVVAMAGIMPMEDWRSADVLATAEQVVTTNLLGPLRLLAAFTEHLQGHDGATFVTVSSGLAHVPLIATPVYNATKAAIHSLSEGVRLQLEPVGVQVVEIVPPAVSTTLTPHLADNPAALPLDAFADEVMALLAADPDAHEVLVDAVQPLRRAELDGRYAETLAQLNGLDLPAAAR